MQATDTPERDLNVFPHIVSIAERNALRDRRLDESDALLLNQAVVRARAQLKAPFNRCVARWQVQSAHRGVRVAGSVGVHRLGPVLWQDSDAHRSFIGVRLQGAEGLGHNSGVSMRGGPPSAAAETRALWLLLTMRSQCQNAVQAQHVAAWPQKGEAHHLDARWLPKKHKV